MVSQIIKRIEALENQNSWTIKVRFATPRGLRQSEGKCVTFCDVLGRVLLEACLLACLLASVPVYVCMRNGQGISVEKSAWGAKRVRQAEIVLKIWPELVILGQVWWPDNTTSTYNVHITSTSSERLLLVNWRFADFPKLNQETYNLSITHRGSVL